MKRVATLRARTGTYVDQQSGQEKASYTTIGHVLEGDKGMMYKIDTLPVNFDGWVYQGDLPTKQVQAQAPTTFADLEDDVPF
jgi:hypothetical protein